MIGILIVCLMSVSAAPPARNAAALSPIMPAQSAGAGLPVLDVVMLVDESGSETAVSVAQERQVAATVGQAMLNPASRITVVGFGGVNNLAPNQDPINVACVPTVVDSQQNLDYLSTCVNSLHRRSELEGDDTDYAAALGQAMSYFEPQDTYGAQSPPGAIKVMLMMTDGGVDVHRDTQQYGQNWMLGETQAIDKQMAAARKYDVELWTLGMGTDVTPANEAYLQQLAASGAPSPCGETPHSTLVTNRADAMAALNQLYAEAACAGIVVDPPTPIDKLQNGELQVNIPAFATDAAISVDRGDPGVQVSFYQPDGTPWPNASAISGQDGVVEVLHIPNPAAGSWTMRLTAPSDLQSELVSATAFYQGAVRAIITANPPSAQPGERICVTLSVLGSNGPITDPAEVTGLRVGVTATGDELGKPTPVAVSNTSPNNCASTGAASYAGVFQAPNTSGDLTFTGTAEGYGLFATEVPASVQVGTAGTRFQATVQYPTVASVQAGSSIQGQIVFTNTTSSARTVLVTLSNVSGAVVTLTRPSGPVTVPSGSPRPVGFTVAFASKSPVGTASLTVNVTAVASPGTVYADGPPLTITVTKPPGFIAKYLWVIIAILIALIVIIAAVLAMRARRRYNADARPLRAGISHDGAPRGAELKPLGKWSDTFRFIIRDEDDEYARLEHPDPADPAPVYTVKRSGRGQVRLWTPRGEDKDVTLGGAGVLLDSGLRLSLRDTRRASSGRPSRSRPSAPPPQPPPTSPSPGSPPAIPTSPASPGSAAPPVEVPPEHAGGWDDPWLNS
jgi:von Willebrand factor type A domain